MLDYLGKTPNFLCWKLIKPRLLRQYYGKTLDKLLILCVSGVRDPMDKTMANKLMIDNTSPMILHKITPSVDKN